MKKNMEQHGLSHLREYKLWASLIQKCTNPGCHDWPRFGAIGITVCEDWSVSFSSFFRYVGPKPSRFHRLVRFDKSEGFRPGNVGWQTAKCEMVICRVCGISFRRLLCQMGGEVFCSPKCCRSVDGQRYSGGTRKRQRRLVVSNNRPTELIIWRGMMDRCYNLDSKAYKRYGGRGITVCERWHSYDNFLSDMGFRPSRNHSLGRVDNDANYEPSNVEWQLREQQDNNTSRSHYLEFSGERLTISQWGKRLNINPGTIHYRLASGASIPEALAPVERIMNRLIESHGESLTIRGWADKLSLPYRTVQCAIRRGLSIDEIKAART